MDLQKRDLLLYMLQLLQRSWLDYPFSYMLTELIKFGIGVWKTPPYIWSQIFDGMHVSLKAAAKITEVKYVYIMTLAR